MIERGFLSMWPDYFITATGRQTSFPITSRNNHLICTHATAGETGKVDRFWTHDIPGDDCKAKMCQHPQTCEENGLRGHKTGRQVARLFFFFWLHVRAVLYQHHHSSHGCFPRATSLALERWRRMALEDIVTQNTANSG